MTSVSDNFNRSDGNLDGSTASGGGTWVEFENDGWTIESNAAKATKGTNYQDHSARLDGVDFDSDDHEVEAKWVVDNGPGSGFLNVGVLARKEDNSTKTFYMYTIRAPANLTRLEKFVAGSWTAIGNGTTTVVLNDIIRLKCDGDQISGYLNDVLEVGPITDSSIAGSTFIQAGLFLDGGDVAGNFSLDDFSGQDLAGGTTYEQAAAGTLTTAGVYSLLVSLSYAGALTSAGALLKQTALSYAGALSSAGALVGQGQKALVGSLSSAGTLAKTTILNYAGTLTSLGTISAIKTFLQALAGGLTSSGVLSNLPAKQLLGSLSSSGTIAKATAVSYAGSLSSAGTVLKKTILSYAGSLTSSGILSSIKNAVVETIDLTLNSRSVSFLLNSRSTALTLVQRAIDFTVGTRD